MKLWRPVGPQELDKIKTSGMRSFPPRLPEQPIFYPVLTFEYAEKIARDWNSTREDHEYQGYVTEFDLAEQYARQFTPQPAGGGNHMEFWVPAEDLPRFNENLTSEITVAARYQRGRRVL